MNNKVLIAYTTTSDPWRKQKDESKWIFNKTNGPAQTVTAALALRPDRIYLLYTDNNPATSTKANFETTKKFLEEHIYGVVIEGVRLDISEITDYNELADKLPDVLERIKLENPGKNFHLISGLPQARYFFILCLTANVLSGELLEVPYAKPWPNNFENGDVNSVFEEFDKRIQRIDMRIFTHFQEVYRDKFNAYRIRINIEEDMIMIDNKPWKLRSGTACSYFVFLLVVVALKLYGPNKILIKELQTKIYRTDTASNAWRAQQMINKKIFTLTSKSALPIKEFIIKNEMGYTITDSLRPAEFMIKIEGNIRNLFVRKFSKAVIDKYFPSLPS